MGALWTKAHVTRAAVIGAGAMGGGIAAQFANAGITVDLLDVSVEAAQAGIAGQIKAGGFMVPGAAERVRPGSTEALSVLAEADWIVEAVVEDLAVKRALFARVDAVRKPGSAVSSNTSTLRRAALIEGASEAFARDFTITHFFNPPRLMPLMELVTGPENDAALDARLRGAARDALGKEVIACRDTPGFVANRIGCYWIAVSLIEAARAGLTVEEADAVQAALGVPRTGVFGLMDLVGIDLIPHVWGALMASLPESDALRDHDLPDWALTRRMVEAGQHGRKAGAGFYRKGQGGVREALDLETGQYRPSVPAPNLPGGGRDIGALLGANDRLGRYGARVLALVLAYAGAHGAEIAEDPADVDRAMALGYSWRTGPFGLAAQIGAEALRGLLEREGLPVPDLLAGPPPRPVPAPERIGGAVEIAGNSAASLRALGDGVACFEIHRKLNALSPEVFDVLEDALGRAGREFGALVIANGNPRAFSAGADLEHFLATAEAGDFAGLEAFVARGQAALMGLKYAPVPVVAAVQGVALGGGCEMALHCDAVVAHAEARMGLPEAALGIIPGWGGSVQMMARRTAQPGGPLAAARDVFEFVGRAGVAGSAPEARGIGLLREGDGYVMHPAALLDAAVARAQALREGYAPPERALIAVTGESGYLSLMAGARGERAAGRASETDLRLAGYLARAVTGPATADPLRPVAEEELLALEREAVVVLARTPETRARIAHFRNTGKPLRN
ncbi:MAG: 3-hydroxyacyl-CoA dehydrogenase/enoyl-CoA hydratase family protein [Vannielia sp.]|uniref:3-hydroxyacyl-CoA dehydrogenase/enoyl-CoA hydratase family protein n=1 Tax=Vannielia sp. TaxID=2813045 RepID=UPI003B8C758B